MKDTHDQLSQNSEEMDKEMTIMIKDIEGCSNNIITGVSQEETT